MPTKTYGEAFAFDIHQIDPQELFEWWLDKDPVFVCGGCDEEFRAGRDVEEDDEILCGRCRKATRKKA